MTPIVINSKFFNTNWPDLTNQEVKKQIRPALYNTVSCCNAKLKLISVVGLNYWNLASKADKCSFLVFYEWKRFQGSILFYLSDWLMQKILNEINAYRLRAKALIGCQKKDKFMSLPLLIPMAWILDDRCIEIQMMIKNYWN